MKSCENNSDCAENYFCNVLHNRCSSCNVICPDFPRDCKKLCGNYTIDKNGVPLPKMILEDTSTSSMLVDSTTSFPSTSDSTSDYTSALDLTTVFIVLLILMIAMSVFISVMCVWLWYSKHSQQRSNSDTERPVAPISTKNTGTAVKGDRIVTLILKQDGTYIETPKKSVNGESIDSQTCLISRENFHCWRGPMVSQSSQTDFGYDKDAECFTEAEELVDTDGEDIFLIESTPCSDVTPNDVSRLEIRSSDGSRGMVSHSSQTGIDYDTDLKCVTKEDGMMETDGADISPKESAPGCSDVMPDDVGAVEKRSLDGNSVVRAKTRQVVAVQEDAHTVRTSPRKVRRVRDKHSNAVHYKKKKKYKANAPEARPLVQDVGLPPQSQMSMGTDMSVCGTFRQGYEAPTVLPSFGLPLESQMSTRTDMSLCGSYQNGHGITSNDWDINENRMQPDVCSSTNHSRQDIFRILRRMPLVEGYYSTIGAIQVFVDLEIHRREFVTQQLATETGAHPSLFEIKDSVNDLS